MQTPEGYEKADIDKYLDTIGCWYCKPATFGFGKSGTPDRIGCMGGVFFSIEVKRPGKEPTPLQHRRMTEIMHNGGVAWWGTADKVIPEIKEFRRVQGYAD